MSKNSAAFELSRRQQLIQILQHEPRTKKELVEILGVHMRTLEKDLLWIRHNLPDQLEETGRPIRLRWLGQPPTILEQCPTWLSEHEILALVVARGLLRDPSKPGYNGLLAQAVDSVLTRCGLSKHAKDLSPQAIEVNRFGAVPEDPTVLAEILAAVVCGDPIECDYLPLKGPLAHRHLLPLRACLIEGEFHVLAADGTLASDGQPLIKDYRISRLSVAHRVATRPPGLPKHIPQSLINTRTAAAFKATASQEPSAHQRVVLLLSPDAHRRLDGRTFGQHQTWEALPDGWYRLSFTTSGMADCQHWVLSQADQIRVEEPESLQKWLLQQAETMVKTYLKTGVTHKGT